LKSYLILGLRVTRVPLNLWNEETFTKMVGQVGCCMKIFDETKNFEQLKYARERVKMLIQTQIASFKKYEIVKVSTMFG